jgi:hypothetical protein
VAATSAKASANAKLHPQDVPLDCLRFAQILVMRPTETETHENGHVFQIAAAGTKVPAAVFLLAKLNQE